MRSTLDHERRAGSTVRPQGGTMPTLQPRTPSSNVKEQSIKIPDFFEKVSRERQSLDSERQNE